MKINFSITLKAIGVFSIVGAIFGLFYSYQSYDRISSVHFIVSEKTPHFLSAYYLILLITVTLLLMLLWSGFQLFFKREAVVQLFVATCILIACFAVGLGFLWSHPIIGDSVAAATGVASGGVSLFEILLFPLWAPFIVKRAFKKEKDISPI